MVNVKEWLAFAIIWENYCVWWTWMIKTFKWQIQKDHRSIITISGIIDKDIFEIITFKSNKPLIPISAV